MSTTMANAFVHKTEVADSMTVETTGQLREALTRLYCGEHDLLAETYVVERIHETLSDGSVANEIRIRKAGRV